MSMRGATTSNARCPSRCCCLLGGFTIVEILVVIAILGALAALGIGLASLAGRMSQESRVRVELNQLAGAIDAYKAHFGFYPPDNPGNPWINQLFYELSGAVFTGSGFRSSDQDGEIPLKVISDLFNAKGFSNSARDPKEVRTFVHLKPRQHHIIYTNPIVEALVVPLAWPPDNPKFPSPLPPVMGTINPWRYVSTKPTNNPSGFDLWAEVVIGGKRRVIGNWRE
jgi:prepilin-type N-terminal cleavage/methylation domain-containing protein